MPSHKNSWKRFNSLFSTSLILSTKTNVYTKWAVWQNNLFLLMLVYFTQTCMSFARFAFVYFTQITVWYNCQSEWECFFYKIKAVLILILYKKQQSSREYEWAGEKEILFNLNGPMSSPTLIIHSLIPGSQFIHISLYLFLSLLISLSCSFSHIHTHSHTHT